MCRPLLLVIRLWTCALLMGCVGSVSGQQPAAAPLTVEQKEKLKERDRLLGEFKQLLIFKDKEKEAEAFEKYQRILAIDQAVFGSISQDTVKSIERMESTLGTAARLHELGRNFAGALNMRGKILALAKARHGKDDYRVTSARLALENVVLLGRLDETALDQLHEAQVLLARVGVLHQEGKDRGAVALAEKALKIQEQILGEKHPHYTAGLNNLAMLYESRGDYARAEPLYRRVLAIDKEVLGEKHPEYALSLSGLGSLYYSWGDYARAEPLLRQTVEIQKEILGEKHPHYATCLNNLAFLYHSRGDYARAEPLLRQALEIQKQSLGEKHPLYTASLNNLATLYDSRGDYARAEPLYRQALAIRKQVLGEKHPYYARSLNSMATLYQSRGEYARAEPLLRQALAIQKEILGEQHPDYATSLNALGSLYQSRGDYAKAEPLCLQALEIQKEILGGKHPDCAASLHNLAFLCQSRGNYAQAEPLYRLALAINKEVLGENHPHHAKSLSSLAGMYESRGDFARAEPLYRQALEIIRRQMDLSAAAQSERQQRAMGDSVRDYLDSYLSACHEGKLPAVHGYRQMLPWKGSVLVKQRRLRVARRDSRLAPLVEDLQGVCRRLATLAFATPEPAQREAFARQIVDLNQRKERLEAELADKSGLFRAGQRLADLSPKQLQAALPAGTVLVDFLEYGHSAPDPEKKGSLTWERRLTAFVVARDREIVRIELGPVAAIAAAVDQYRTAILKGRRPGSADDDPANILRKLVWQPLEKHLKGVKLVLLSPDGAINRLPFGALPGSKKGSYLIEEQEMAIVPVPQLLPAMFTPLASRDRQGAEGVLAIGDVDYGAEPGLANAGTTRGFAIISTEAIVAAKRPRWDRLAATGPEIDAVARLFRERFPKGEVKVLRRADATEGAFRKLAPHYRYLHVATHGFFANPKVRSALFPSEKQSNPFLRQQFGDKGFVGHNPDLLSGLVLAGASSPIKVGHDDGILTALEIRDLDLDKVDLAVLSACQTGLGAVAGGEGILGLQRGFQAAGAGTLVTSLWTIPDKATQVLMDRFYDNIFRKKMPKLEALREAQLWMLHEGPKDVGLVRGLKLEAMDKAKPDATLPPLYWAAFVLSGDWR